MATSMTHSDQSVTIGALREEVPEGRAVADGEGDEVGGGEGRAVQDGRATMHAQSSGHAWPPLRQCRSARVLPPKYTRRSLSGPLRLEAEHRDAQA